MSTIHRNQKAFTTVATLSILVLLLTSCGLVSEAKQDIPVKPSQAERVSPCVVKTLHEMGFTPRVTPGSSPTAVNISASHHSTVVSSTPAVIIDVASEGGANPVRVTVKGVGGPVPVSVSLLNERTEEFASRFNACVN